MLSHVLGSLIKTDFLANTEMCRTARSAEREKPRPFKTVFIAGHSLYKILPEFTQGRQLSGIDDVLVAAVHTDFLVVVFWWCFFSNSSFTASPSLVSKPYLLCSFLFLFFFQPYY